MNYVVLVLKGIGIGIANAIPGVSGGTFAVIMKIYDKLLEAVTPNIKKLIKNMPFLIPVAVGMALGIIIAAKLLAFLFETYYVPTQLFFVGLILGSMPMIYRECTKERKLRPVNVIPFVIGVGIMIGMMFLTPDSSSGITDELTPVNILLFALSAFIAAVAMVIPGISGALMIKVLGTYDAAIMAVNDLNIPVLIVFAVGAVIGIFAAAAIISALMKKFRTETYCVIAGLIIGSVPNVFPSGFSFDTQGIVGIVLMLIGLAVPTLSELPSRGK
jgi:putative membrane protein